MTVLVRCLVRPRPRPALGPHGADWPLVERGRCAARHRPAPHGQHRLASACARATARRLPVWITRPAGRPAAPRPTVVLVHGGPWVRGRALALERATRSSWPRAATSSSSPSSAAAAATASALFRAGWQQWGQAMQDDVADALAWAVKQGLADPARVCIAGASYGGYATLMGLVTRPRALPLRRGLGGGDRPALMFQWRTSSDQHRRRARVRLPQLIGDPVADAALLDAVSPVVQAARIKAPVLLAFGEKDRRVPLVHGQSHARRAAAMPSVRRVGGLRRRGPWLEPAEDAAGFRTAAGEFSRPAPQAVTVGTRRWRSPSTSLPTSAASTSRAATQYGHRRCFTRTQPGPEHAEDHFQQAQQRDLGPAEHARHRHRHQAGDGQLHGAQQSQQTEVVRRRPSAARPAAASPRRKAPRL